MKVRANLDAQVLNKNIMTTSHKIDSFDIARALGMIYIIAAWHLHDYTSMITLRPYGTYVTYGMLGMFMFISGWLLNDKYAVSRKTDIVRFAKKRVLRLAPLYFIALLSFYFFDVINVKTLVLALTGLSSFIPPQPPTLWFVSLIIDFYLLFPLLSYKRPHFSGIVFWVVYFAMCVLLRLTTGIDKRFLIYFPCFYIGILFNRYRLLQYLLQWRVFLGSVVLFCISLLMDSVISIRFLRIANSSLAALSFTSIIIYISHILTYLQIKGIWTWIAYSSMAAYMFHRQIIGAFRRFSIWPEDGPGRLLFLLLVCFPIVLITGFVLQSAYDSIVKRLGRNKRLFMKTE